MTNMASFFTTAAAAIALAVPSLKAAPAVAFVTPSFPTNIASREQRQQSNLILHSTSESKAGGPKLARTIYDEITINDKLTLRDPTPEERGKGGVTAVDTIQALEVLARIPRNLILAAASSVEELPSAVVDAVADANNITWATELTAVTLASLHPTADEEQTDTIKKQWIQSWQTGGWGTPSDLGPDISNDIVGPTILTTGSDNDHNIYAKFRMPCHPALFKASMGLELLTKCTQEQAREALYARGFTYRSMRDALQSLVVTSTTEHDKSIKGTLRDKRCWDVADTFSKVLARAATLTLDDDTSDCCAAIVPIHERLAHSLNGGNTKLVSIESEVLLVATCDIEAGDEITRDYTLAPRLETDESTEVGSALHLLLQFGLPPSSFTSA